jgi:hypothetical protein
VVPIPHAALADNKFRELDKLLNQTDMYSRFLSEQLEDIETSHADELAKESVSEATKAGTKRKASPRGHATKKGRVEASVQLSPTQVRLFAVPVDHGSSAALAMQEDGCTG